MTPKLDKHQRLELALARRRRLDGSWIRHGWLPDFSDPRFGWWWYSADGTPHYLGKTFEEAEKALQSPDT